MLLHFVQYWPPPPAPVHLCSGLCHQLVGRTASNFDQLQSALMINSHNFLLSPALHLRCHMVSQRATRTRTVPQCWRERKRHSTERRHRHTRHRHTGHGTARHGGRAAGGGSLVLPPVLFPPSVVHVVVAALPFCSSSPTASFMWQPTTPMYCWCPRPGRQLRHRPIRHFLLHSVGSRRSRGFMEFIEFKEVYGVFLRFMAG